MAPKSLIAKPRVQHGASAAAVNIHVRKLAQLFNSLDPSPFWGRDLDRAAAEFIEEEFSEKLSAKMRRGQLALLGRLGILLVSVHVEAARTEPGGCSSLPPIPGVTATRGLK